MLPHGFAVSSFPATILDSTPASSGLSLVDLFGLGVIVLFLVLGALHGLWWQVVRLLGIVASVAVARAVAPRFSPALADGLPGLGNHAANGITWLFVLMIGLLAVAVVGRVGRASIGAAQLAPLDRVGGAVAGVISGGLVHVAFLLVACQIASPAWKAERLEGTQSEALLAAVGREIPVLLDAHAAESLPDSTEPGPRAAHGPDTDSAPSAVVR
jgi:uncharacterized membrane protein required for colicin V production